MGVRFREPSDSAASTATVSPSLREVLLFTTMSIIGLTVEVHIKDGSVYSGIFHTASVENGYGIVLKKARLIKKGAHASNGLNRSLIDTLVVLPENLVQVLAKSVMISSDGEYDGVGCDNLGAVTSDVKSYGGSEKETNSAYSQLHEQTKIRQNGVHRSQEEEVSDDKPGFGVHKEKPVHKVQASSINSKSEGCKLQVKSRKESDKVVTKQLPNGTVGKIASQNTSDSHCQSQADSNANKTVVSKQLPNGTPRKITSQNTSDSRCQSQADSNAVKTVVSIMSDKTCSSSATMNPVVPVQNSASNKSSKESKLNPGAKIFSPSYANVRSVAAPPVLSGGANVSYIPSYFSAVPLAPQSEIGIRSFPPCPSLPLKVVSYGNVATTNGGVSGLQQYTQPIAGSIPNRLQPIRYSNQYQLVQPGPTFVQPVPQNGLMGRAGQLVYINPATHELVSGPPPFSNAPHSHLTSHSLHFPKHEGVIPAPPPPLSFTRPLMANDHHPFAVPSPVPFSQPAYTSIRPVSILPYGAKYL